MVHIAVLVSGGGTNLQALLDAQEAGAIRNGRIVKVIASRPDAYALERAAAKQVPTAVVSRKAYATPEAFDEALLAELEACGAELVVLAGFLSILGEKVIARYRNRILNVHPSLIPAFCGKGFYGLKVHEAALAYGVKVTGATVQRNPRRRGHRPAKSGGRAARRYSGNPAAARHAAGGMGTAAPGGFPVLRRENPRGRQHRRR